jgi:hypothetical protein
MSELHVVSSRRKRKMLNPISHEEIKQNLIKGKEGQMLDSQHLLISMMLPPAVKAFFEEMEAEVEALCGKRFSREAETSRYGAQPGSIILGNQRVSIKRPRVRGTDGEVPLTTYARFQDPNIFDKQVFN